MFFIYFWQFQFIGWLLYSWLNRYRHIPLLNYHGYLLVMFKLLHIYSLLCELESMLEILQLFFSSFQIAFVLVNFQIIDPIIKWRRLTALLCLYGSMPFVVVDFFFESLDELLCFHLLVRIIIDCCFVQSNSRLFHVALFFSSKVMLFGFDPVLKCLADESISGGSLDVLNAQVAVVVLIFGGRVGLLCALVVDEVILGDDGLIAESLEVLLVGVDEWIDSLWHFGCKDWQFPVEEC